MIVAKDFHIQKEKVAKTPAWLIGGGLNIHEGFFMAGVVAPQLPRPEDRNRPRAALQGRPCEWAGSARKRSSAEGGCPCNRSETIACCGGAAHVYASRTPVNTSPFPPTSKAAEKDRPFSAGEGLIANLADPFL